MYYHASNIPGVRILEPRISNHGRPLVYLSKKRENVLPYLSNAVEKYCRETGFVWDGGWRKWASYGFSKDGRLYLAEYYPNAIRQTYGGVSGYIYSAAEVSGGRSQKDIPDAVTTGEPVAVERCEFIPDAYEAILRAARAEKILLLPYEKLPEGTLAWLRETLLRDYRAAEDHPDYRHFLEGKFPGSFHGKACDPFRMKT